MKNRMLLTCSSAIILIILLASPAWVQATPQLPLPDQDGNVTAPTGGGGGISPYHTTRQRLSENTIDDYAPVVAYNPKRDEYLVVWSECLSTSVCNVVGRRTTGQGELADQIGQTFRVFAHKYGLDQESPPLDTSQFRAPPLKSGQLRLF